MVAAARGRPIPAADEIPSEDQYGPPATMDPSKNGSKNFNNLAVPIVPRSQSINSDSSSNLSPPSPGLPLPESAAPAAAPSSASTIFRGRAKTLASLTTASKGPQTEMTPREIHLPKDHFVNGQPIEAYLYKDAAECPICFLYYPPHLNKTRCCDQAICSECFVQIKRPDPHPPEHGNPSASVSLEAADSRDMDGEGLLVSEPAACPFCVQPEFGITYEPPSFRRGLTYVNQVPPNPLSTTSPAMSSSSSLASAMSGGGQISSGTFGRRRTTSISATSSVVITTDRVRPDWHQKLSGARAHAARRSAAATALHTAAYLMGNRNHETDGRGFSAFGRRGILRRASGNDGSLLGAGPSQLNMLALMSERYGGSSGGRAEATSAPEGESIMVASTGGSSRRSRMDDLEDMMMLEAIRLSLASEEERRKREEKDAKKEAKKKDKETRKAEKIARKAGIYSTSANQSTAGIESPASESSPINDHFPASLGKGKANQQTSAELSEERSQRSENNFPSTKTLPATDSTADTAQEHLKRARAHLQPNDALPLSAPHNANPYRPSHLRTLSNASSSGSSVGDSAVASLNDDFGRSNSSFEVSPNASGVNILPRGSAQDIFVPGTPPGGGAGIEPMFNFRSLAAMVGDDEKAENSANVDHLENLSNEEPHRHHRQGKSSTSVALSSDMGGSVGTKTRSTNATILGGNGLGVPREGGTGAPELKITSQTRTNSTQAHSDNLNEGKALDSAAIIDAARTIS